jgi:type I restriction enzyme S subunit
MMDSENKHKETEIGFIPLDWEIKQLKDVVSKLGDGLHGTPNYDDSGDYYFVNGNNLVDGQIQFNKHTKKCSKEEFEKYKKDLTRRTLFVSINGTLGNVARYNNEKIILGKSACYLTIKDQYSLQYIKYVLYSPHFQRSILSHATGTTIKNVSLKQMRDFKFSIPKNYNEQKEIAKIILDLDKKRRVLRDQNKYLEQMGQQLYKHWFIDFEFPNDAGESYKSSNGEFKESDLGEIPDDWEVGYLGDGSLTKLIKTGINNFNAEKIYLATACVEGNNIIDESTKITISDRPSRANMQPISKSIWFAKMKDSKKILLFDDYNKDEINNYILSTGFAGLLVQDNALSFIWSIISSNWFEAKKDSLCLGTTMQAINNGNIVKIKHLVPSENVLNKFTELINPLHKRIAMNKIEEQILLKIRTVLLPELMTGKIRVTVDE